jgi:LuxR family maltose regulon positive regulatory protein
LERPRQDAEAHGRTGSLIELLALGALVDVAAGRRDKALRVLQQALTLAMPEGYARVFLDEGAPMQALLAACRVQLAQQGHGLASEGGRRLLAYISDCM